MRMRGSWIRSTGFWVALLFLWNGLIVDPGETALSGSRPAKTDPGFVRKEVYPVSRDVPMLPDVVIVKRTVEGLMKGARVSWERSLQRVNAVGVEPMFAARQDDGIGLSRIFRVRLAPGTDVYEAVNLLWEDPSVVWVEPEYLRKLCYDPNDPSIGFQWYFANVEARAAWDVFRGNDGVVIGIVDTGVDWDHPDLAENIWTNLAEIPNNGLDDDGNGYTDDVRGWDFGDGDSDPRPDLSGHGTLVAGVASAVTDNGVGMAAPAFNAKIMPVKLSVRLSGADVQVYNWLPCIEYAVDNGADVINCSFGGPGASNAERDVMTYARSRGVLVVAARGNDDDEALHYPSGYPGVLSVAATDALDRKTYFTSYGYGVTVSAPGVGMYTTSGQSGYTWVDGTSFSSSLAAGIAALVKGWRPDWSGDRVREQVRVSADPIDGLNPSYERKLGYGRVNAYRALTVESPSVRLSGFDLIEGAGGNGNGMIDPGEEVLLTFRFTNYLQPAAGVWVHVGVENPDVTVSNADFDFAGLSTLEEKGNVGNPVRMQVSSSAERGQTVEVFFTVSADGGYEDFEVRDFVISPVYATVQGGNVALTVTSTGRLGFADYSTNRMGEGFVFGDTPRLLFEGAVVAATGTGSVSDVARGADYRYQNDDFDTVPDGELVVQIPGEMADEEGRTVFSDEETLGSLNLRVSQTTLAFADPPDDDYVLLAYRLSPVSSNTIQGLYFGLFMDWDVGYDPNTDAHDNVPGYRTDLGLGYVYHPNFPVYCGLRVVSEGGTRVYRSINNSEIYDGYTDAEKWSHLSGGIQPIGNTSSFDYSHVVGVGPLTLNPGDTVLVGFAVLGGSDLDDLTANAGAAQAKWQSLFGQTGVDDWELPPGRLSFDL